MIGAGWALGDRWHQVNRYGTYSADAFLAALAVGIGGFVWRRRAPRRTSRDIGQAMPLGHDDRSRRG